MSLPVLPAILVSQLLMAAPQDAGDPAPDGGARAVDAGQASGAEPRSEAIASNSFRWAQAADGSWILVASVDPAPGWHVYWTNPGDSGNAPSFQVTVPDGWRAGKTVYPRPEAKVVDGSVFYGYSRSVQYLIPVRRSDAMSADSWPGNDPPAGGKWKVRAKVMACKERCVMVTLAAGGECPPSADAGSGIVLDGGSFGGRSLPAKAATAGIFARLETDTVRIEGPAQGHGSVRFIPAGVPGMQIDIPEGSAAIEGTVEGGNFKIKFRLASPGVGPGEPAVAGLILLGNSPADPCVWLSIPHPLAGPDGSLGGNGVGASGLPDGSK
jgi:hypothetical protein